ncbi:MAG: RDD family protein [Helicobacteraceae bacterium]|jgi:uncharacterized RDD family membrane protein YckC|nr:RDD family protein [Helicobacteraceae bacterium]
MISLKPAGFWARFVASIIDIFMIVIPIVFAANLAIGYEAKPALAWLAHTAVFALITIAFWTRKGYTPGKKYMRLIVLDCKTNKTMYPPQACLRFICECLSFASVIGVLLPVFRKDKKTLHDLLSGTRVVCL